MADNTGGFTQEQLVIYKLGQIESQLASLLVKVSESTQNLKEEINSVKDRTTKLENANTNLRVDRAKVAGATGVVVFIGLILKGFAEKWLGLHFLT